MMPFAYYHSINKIDFDPISIKSEFGVEFRRYSLDNCVVKNFDCFYKRIEHIHQLWNIPFVIFYKDSENEELPINNNANLAKAICSAKCISYQSNPYNMILRRKYLKLLIREKGYLPEKKCHNFKGLSFSSSANNDQSPRPSIGVPEDFRQVSSIIDVHKMCRRVRIVKHGGSDRPLGFFIRDGNYKRMNCYGQLELVTGVFISKLVPGGLAESTGLLAVNDEVLEVNGIPITQGKTLDQVTDMMVANSSNLIMTIRPTGR